MIATVEDGQSQNDSTLQNLFVTTPMATQQTTNSVVGLDMKITVPTPPPNHPPTETQWQNLGDSD